MVQKKRKSAEERRTIILDLLKSADDPIKGNDLAEKMQVSRQVIVQDISLLKAAGKPIIATSQGYLLLQKPHAHSITKMVACNHTISETEDELTRIVKCGVTVLNVTVEHPLYGEITRSLMIRNLNDVQHFIDNLEKSGASLLSSLTGGVHLHELEADSSEKLDRATASLKEAGYLL
ncbi:transcription repressor NadR [Sporolactobacillus sp. CPB3-1]|uniref:Transcription repressor NadR n=1 Tax=Sporolactobacillus mangiferae TaxID=2940498 RepID=A0ABT0M6N3_9BACL|nr:transcription repressor NadR [Sporolactobacillus mangiferae]MCL1630502.1 transcription repressor NadR [Sporolactobacillus mangiferae]